MLETRPGRDGGKAALGACAGREALGHGSRPALGGMAALRPAPPCRFGPRPRSREHPLEPIRNLCGRPSLFLSFREIAMPNSQHVAEAMQILSQMNACMPDRESL